MCQDTIRLNHSLASCQSLSWCQCTTSKLLTHTQCIPHTSVRVVSDCTGSVHCRVRETSAFVHGIRRGTHVVDPRGVRGAPVYFAQFRPRGNIRVTSRSSQASQGCAQIVRRRFARRSGGRKEASFLLSCMHFTTSA